MSPRNPRDTDVPIEMDDIDDLTPPLGHVDDPVQRKVNDRIWRRIELETKDRAREIKSARELAHATNNALTKIREELTIAIGESDGRLNAHVAEAEVRVSALEKDLARVAMEIDRLEIWRAETEMMFAVVFGHEKTRDPGRIGRLETKVSENTDMIEKQNKIIERLDRVFWKIVIAATTGGAIAGVGISILRKLM